MDIPMLFHAQAEIKNTAEYSDVLIARAQNGDREAFGLIFEHHHRFVFKFIYAMTGEAAAAEELTQETFLGAYKNIHALRGDARLKTWLCGIAKNVVYKSFRTRGKDLAQNDDDIESLDVSGDEKTAPDREFLSKELNQKISKALENLDADKRVVFTLKELQHLSYKEIAEITGHSIPKLKTDLHRAKIEMRAALRPYLEVKK